MRDALIEQVYNKMRQNRQIIFLSGDFGAPALDKIRKEFKDRFINVGIAEQNLINISSGLALEGFIVYAYAIAPFLTMRAYEQIRNNLSLLSQLKELNVNLIGVGAGVSYDISGPTHHCLEDMAIMRLLPNFMVFSPSDAALAEKFVDFSIRNKKPKYIRLDGKPLPYIYRRSQNFNFKDGFYELMQGKEVCIVSTGFMTHKALKVAYEIKHKVNVGVVDVFSLKPINRNMLFAVLKKYKYVITVEEAFINKGGLDSLIADLLDEKCCTVKLKKIGFKDKYVFDIGNRDYLHKIAGIDEQSITKVIMQTIKTEG
jgi:transketolase